MLRVSRAGSGPTKSTITSCGAASLRFSVNLAVFAPGAKLSQCTRAQASWALQERRFSSVSSSSVTVYRCSFSIQLCTWPHLAYLPLLVLPSPLLALPTFRLRGSHPHSCRRLKTVPALSPAVIFPRMQVHSSRRLHTTPSG